MLLPTQYNCLIEHPLCGVPLSVIYNTFYSPPPVATCWFTNTLRSLFCANVFCLFAVPFGAAFLAHILT